MVTRIAPLLLVLLLGACARPERAPEVAVPTPVARPPPVAAAAVAPALPKQKKPGPIATRPLNATIECSFRDETGYNGMMKLAVEEARVRSFEAAVNIPSHGTCRFDLKNFRQTRKLPNVELRHFRDRCIVHMWEQGEQVTVAFQQCQKMCTGKAWDHLWPVLIDRRDGSCA